MRDGLAQMFDRIWYGHSIAAWLLWPLCLVYRAAFEADRVMRQRRRTAFRAPVIVVGNVTVGGAGKTPLVIWLVRALAERGFSPGIVSRGYGGAAIRTPRRVTGEDDAALVGDEPVLLARDTERPVVVCADRNAAVELLLRDEAIDVVVADDGLQHHALARQCEIAVVDGARGLGNGLCLPAGPLREPARRLSDVDIVVVNGRGWTMPGAIVAELKIAAVERLDGTGARSIDTFRGRDVQAFAAIGNPLRFFDLLSRHGLVVAGHAKADHAPLSAAELRASMGSTVMVTEKDAVKLDRNVAGDIWSVRVEYEFRNDDAERLMAKVLSKLASGTP